MYQNVPACTNTHPCNQTFRPVAISGRDKCHAERDLARLRTVAVCPGHRLLEATRVPCMPGGMRDSVPNTCETACSDDALCICSHSSSAPSGKCGGDGAGSIEPCDPDAHMAIPIPICIFLAMLR